MIEKMFTNTKLLDSNEHKDIKIIPTTTYAQTKEMLFCPIGLNEFFECSKSYMIAFKGNEKEIIPTIILGSENNMFLDEENNWKSNCYIPQVIRTYPFGVTMVDNREIIVIDEDATCISKENGTSIFDENSKATESTNKIVQFASQSYSNLQNSAQLFAQLLEYKVLDLVQFNLERNDEKKDLGNYYIVNEQKMQKLNSREFKKLGMTGLLNFIYLHLNSLKNRYDFK